MVQNKQTNGSIAKIPIELKIFERLGFEYDESKTVESKLGTQAYGTCIFCNKEKFYVNTSTGLWDCKHCKEKGNVYTFMQLWYDLHLEAREKYNDKFIALANDRQLSPEILKEAGIIFDGEQFAVPVYNQTNRLCNLRFYNFFGYLSKKDKKKKHLLIGLPGITAQLYGLDSYSQKGRSKEKIYLMEGEWDAIAMQSILKKEGEEGVILATPGDHVFKREWIDFFSGRDVICCFDKGTSGETGTERVAGMLKPVTVDFQYIQWPAPLPDGYDVRDYVIRDLPLHGLLEMVEEYISFQEREENILRGRDAKGGKRPTLRSHSRPRWKEVQSVYSKHIAMTQDLWDALKVTFATVFTTAIPGCPLWTYLVGPPGCGKTLLLMTLDGLPSSVYRSSITPNLLISGFPRDPDPSLLPRLKNKVLVIKDGTEILTMPRDDKERVFSTLRGAYDGSAYREYGNGQVRNYPNLHFNLLMGVTQKIYEERTSTLGERALFMHVVRGNNYESDDPIMAAMENIASGKQKMIDKELSEIAKAFLDVDITEDDIPEVSLEYKHRIRGLAQLVSRLRACVARDNFRDRKLLLRPQPEMGTRLAAQLYKLLIGLAMINVPVKITEEEMRIVTRVALDTCIGFNLEAMTAIIEEPGLTISELCEVCQLKTTTLRDQLDDLGELGAVYTKNAETDGEGRGRPPVLYYPTKELVRMWETSGLVKKPEQVTNVGRIRRKLKIKCVRRKI